MSLKEYRQDCLRSTFVLYWTGSEYVALIVIGLDWWCSPDLSMLLPFTVVVVVLCWKQNSGKSYTICSLKGEERKPSRDQQNGVAHEGGTTSAPQSLCEVPILAIDLVDQKRSFLKVAQLERFRLPNYCIRCHWEANMLKNLKRAGKHCCAEAW